MINKATIEQYSAIFGEEKMAFLWGEFLDKALPDLSAVDKYLTIGDYNGLRLIYHSLRSCSLVFGMEDFSAECKEIEEQIVLTQSTLGLEEKLKKAQKTFDKDVSDVKEIIER